MQIFDLYKNNNTEKATNVTGGKTVKSFCHTIPQQITKIGQNVITSATTCKKKKKKPLILTYAQVN